MSDYRFILEPYKSMKDKYKCPNCNNKTFTRYIDTQNNDFINSDVGMCSRLIKCSYHLPPKKYFDNNNVTLDNSFYTKPIVRTKPISYIDKSLFYNSLNHTNNFILFLESLFDKSIVKEVTEKYNIGTSNHWQGSTVFWQVDTNQNIRSGKVLLYNKATGKRKKYTNWMHTVLKIEGFNLKQCLFGEHLISQDLNKPIAIVESEKTAIISSIYLPDFIWLASGGLTSLNKEKTKVLKGRKVILFPDLNCFDKWQEKIPQLSQDAKYIVSDLLKNNTTDKEKLQGLDIADYLIKQDWKLYRKQEVKEVLKPEPLPKVEALEAEPLINWDSEIKELEDFFKSIKLPKVPIKLNKSETIENCKEFITNHLATVKANNGKRTFEPYLNRLSEIKTILKKLEPKTIQNNKI